MNDNERPHKRVNEQLHEYLALKKKEVPCLFDNVDPTKPTGMVCNCPKCTIK